MRVLCVMAGSALLTLVALLVVAGIISPWSPSGWAALVATGAGALALTLRAERIRLILGAMGALLMLVVLAAHALGTGHAKIRMVTLPAAGSPRYTARLFDERDASLIGARALSFLWKLPTGESDDLLRAMTESYTQMRQSMGPSPSPVLDTLLGRQQPGAFDTLVIEPSHGTHTGIIFLHGYGGSFSLECWLLAEAAAAIDATTTCPSIDFSGRWDSSRGESALRSTLDYLHSQGIRRVYLAGLSNGAVAAGALAHRVSPGIVGLILISGIPTAPTLSGVPMLVVQGEHDPRVSAPAAQAFASRAHASYVALDAGHFALLIRRAEAGAAIADWLRRNEAGQLPAPSPQGPHQ
jgi:predicted esterase